MAITTDIVATYRHPRQVIRRLLEGPVHEGRLLAYLMLGCLLVFVAQWPRLSREAALNAETDLTELVSGQMYLWIFAAPLFFYFLAALAHLVARIFGGKGSWYGARLATFWTLVALGPLWLLRGLVAGFLGEGLPLDVIGTIALGLFALLWISTLREVEQPVSTGPESAAS